jgi:hypothetical protein
MRNSFKKLLESVKASCPDVITEEVFDGMMDQFDTGLAQVTADATAEGQALGFKEGYDEGKRVAAEQAKAELEALTEKLDAEAVEKLNSILQMIDENHTTKLQELYDYMQNNMVKREFMDAEIAKQDADYANKFETAVDALCDDHACKLEIFKEAIEAKHANDIKVLEESIDKKYTELLEESVKTIDADNTKKLQEVVSLLKEDKTNALKAKEAVLTEAHAKELEETKVLYESKLAESNKAIKAEQDRKLSVLAESVEKYLNYALEQYIPKKQLISEAKYNAALKTLDKVTDLLGVHAIIQESKDGIFAEYESKLAAAKETQNKLINEKIELSAQLHKKEAALLLEEKTKKCTPSEAKFLKTYFKDATSPKVIEESIEAAHATYKKIQAEKRQVLQESVKQEVSQKPSAVVTESVKEEVKEPAKPQVISESTEVEDPQQKLASFYAKCLQGKN